MAGLEMVIDVSLLIKTYKQGVSDGFLIGQSTPELDAELNCNGIGTEDV